MVKASNALGIRTAVFEMTPVWEAQRKGVSPNAEEAAAMFGREGVRAVIGSGVNGVFEWPLRQGADGRTISFFEQLGIPHLQWW